MTGFKPLADTGDYPGKEEIGDGLALCRKLLAVEASFSFIEQFNSLRNDLLEFADQYQEVEQFYAYQKPTWEKLRKACERFQLNRLELDQDAQAGPALKRMQEIIAAPSPYGLIKEADTLIGTVGGVNTALVTESRKAMIENIDGHLARLTKDVDAAQVDAGCRSSCLKPLQSLRQQVEGQDSLAHINQAEAEALRQFDAAVRRLEESVRKAAEKATAASKAGESPPKVVLKTLKTVEPARLVQKTYLETKDDVTEFLKVLREVLEKAIDSEERIQIR